MVRVYGACRPGPDADLDAASTLYEVAPFVPGEPFALRVMRRGSDAAVFDSTGHRLAPVTRTCLRQQQQTYIGLPYCP